MMTPTVMKKTQLMKKMNESERSNVEHNESEGKGSDEEKSSKKIILSI